MTPARRLLNIGCGHQRPKAWINADCSLNSATQKIPVIKVIAKILNKTQYEKDNAIFMNSNRKWPFSDSSLDVVYGSHMFEHLSISQSKFFLSEAFRTLKSGGALRIVVPDLYKISKIYIEDYDRGGANAANNFLYTLNMHKENCYSSQKSAIYKVIAWLQDWPHQHKYMYDKRTLANTLKHNGFSAVTFSSYGQSAAIPEIKDLEITAEGVPSIYAECTKVLSSRPRKDLESTF